LIRSQEFSKKMKIKKQKTKTTKTEKEETQKIKKVDRLRNKFKPLSLQFWRTYYYLNFKRAEIMLIEMELATGDIYTFITPIKANSFEFKKKVYVIDESIKKYDINSKIYRLRYFENLSLPVDESLPVKDLKSAIQNKEKNQKDTIYYALNPQLLHEFLHSDVLKSMMQAGEITAFFKNIRMWVIVATISSVIHLILYAQKSGLLNLK
jgi:hypothetical protein